MKKTLLFITLAAVASAASAQEENLVWNEGVTINALGGLKEWTSSSGQTFEMTTEALEKIIANPTNTSNVYLFPEAGGGWDNADNREIGIQGFYVDLGKSYPIGSVTTTWEGAAADAYEIYVTNNVPTPAILDTEATYSAEGLGQYTQNTAELPAGVSGRYVVFQPTNATNWGWGVKIRSIAIFEPTDNELASFTVAPGIVVPGVATGITLSFSNQFGNPISAEDVTVAVTGDGEVSYANGELTIVSGTYATFSATYAGRTLTSDVYAATAPRVPQASGIKTPIFTNGNPADNSTAEWTVAYNGGAVNYGTLDFSNGTVAQSFGAARCIFFSNSVTTGAWNGNIDPSANGYKSLCLDVFSAKNVDCTIEFESVENLEGGHTYPFSLRAGEWNPIIVDVEGATKLGNLSIRFSETDIDDILLANIYFSDSETTGIENIASAEGNAVNVVNIQGVVVRKNVSKADALSNLPAGLYIIEGKKVIVK